MIGSRMQSNHSPAPIRLPVQSVIAAPTCTAELRWVVVPSPIWDEVLPPAQYIDPPVVTAQVDDEPAETVRWLRKFVTHFEAGRPEPWSLPADPEFTERLARGVVGFRIEIESLTGQWKLNRHHPQARREKTVAALRQQPDENSRAVADLMAAVLPPPVEPTS